MFCTRCGTQLKEGALFCPSCGENMSNQVVKTPQKPKTAAKKLALPLGITGGVVTMIVVAILTVTLFGGTGYKKTLNNYYKAHEKNDADLMYESVIAQYWIDYMNEGWGNSAYESVVDSLEDQIDEWDCGEDIKITYKVTDERRATKEDLEELEEHLYDRYAYYVYDRDEFSITDAYVLEVDFTVRGDNGVRNYHYPDGLLMIKENGKWRIPRGSIDCSFYEN